MTRQSGSYCPEEPPHGLGRVLTRRRTHPIVVLVPPSEVAPTCSVVLGTVQNHLNIHLQIFPEMARPSSLRVLAPHGVSCMACRQRVCEHYSGLQPGPGCASRNRTSESPGTWPMVPATCQ